MSNREKAIFGTAGKFIGILLTLACLQSRGSFGLKLPTQFHFPPHPESEGAGKTIFANDCEHLVTT